jgi:hypothetical protein
MQARNGGCQAVPWAFHTTLLITYKISADNFIGERLICYECVAAFSMAASFLFLIFITR